MIGGFGTPVGPVGASPAPGITPPFAGRMGIDPFSALLAHLGIGGRAPSPFVPHQMGGPLYNYSPSQLAAVQAQHRVDPTGGPVFHPGFPSQRPVDVLMPPHLGGPSMNDGPVVRDLFAQQQAVQRASHDLGGYGSDPRFHSDFMQPAPVHPVAQLLQHLRAAHGMGSGSSPMSVIHHFLQESPGAKRGHGRNKMLMSHQAHLQGLGADAITPIY